MSIKKCVFRWVVWNAALILLGTATNGCLLGQASDGAERNLAKQEKTLPPPNILWLTAEDIGPHLGCYGDKVAKTPNLDHLAKKGMVYRTAWSNYPVCAPARTTLISGIYASSFAAGHMRSQVPLPHGIRLFPEYLRDGGYYCTNNAKEDFNLTKSGKVWDRQGRKANYQGAGEKPFFSVFNFTGTHESQIRNKKGDPKTDPNTIWLSSYYPDQPEVRRDWAHYYDNIAKLDHWVGKQLKKLKDSGQEQNTIVFFFGDHGSGMPRHKRFAGDSGMKVPLIVYVPQKYRKWVGENYLPGTMSDQLVGFVDLGPTVLNLANVSVPGSMQGFPALGKKTQILAKKRYLYGFRSRMDEKVDRSRSMTDGRFVYVRNFIPFLPHGQYLSYQQKTPTTALWLKEFREGKLNPVQSRFWNPKEPEELYDLQTDPDEVRNLASVPAYQEKLVEFRRELKKGQESKFLDAEMFPESWTDGFSKESSVYHFVRTNEGKRQLKDTIRSAWDASNSSVGLDDLIRRLSLPEIHSGSSFWCGIGLLNSDKKPSRMQIEQVSKLRNHSDLMVRTLASEFLLVFGAEESRKKTADALLKVANQPEENYYSAVFAMNVLHRHFAKIRKYCKKDSLSEFEDKKKRGKGYWKRLMDRWKQRSKNTRESVR